MSDEVLDEIESPAEPEASLEDTIADAFDQDEAGTLDEEVSASPESSKPARSRDEKGRFSSKSGQSEEQAGADRTQEESSLSPPRSWPAEKKEQFRQLPREVQQLLLEHEGSQERHFHERSEELARLRDRYSRIDQVVDPYRQQLALEGVDEAQALQQWLALRQLAKQDKGQAAQYVLQQLGVDPRQLAEQGSQGLLHPSLKVLVDEITGVKQQNAELAQYLQQIKLQPIQQELQAFGSATNEKGEPLYPHFASDRIQQAMTPHVQAIRAANPNKSHREILAEAYDRAVWSDPETRNELLAQQEAKRIAESKAKAIEARRAGSSLNGSPGAPLVALPPNDLVAQLQAAWDGQL